MTLFFILLFGLYAVLVIALAFGWARIMDQSYPGVTAFRTISVIVPFRNEEMHLINLIGDLKNQEYPAEKLEVVFADDQSTDQSKEIVLQAIENNSYMKLISLTDSKGKKSALAEGVQNAKGEIIVTTDADCRVSENWLGKINSGFHEGIKMTIGAVRLEEGNSAFSRMQTIEFASLVGTTGATLGLGFPSMCSGANLSFLRSAFYEVDGYAGNEKVSSGDDEFLMRKFFSKWGNCFHFLNDSDAIVRTVSQPTFSKFASQRIRWAGKWKFNSFWIKLLAAGIFLFHLGFIASILFALSGVINLNLFLLLFASKIFTEVIFLFPVCHFLKVRWRWIIFILLQFLYPFYVVAIGLISQFVSTTWKDRKVGKGV